MVLAGHVVTFSPERREQDDLERRAEQAKRENEELKMRYERRIWKSRASGSAEDKMRNEMKLQELQARIYYDERRGQSQQPQPDPPQYLERPKLQHGVSSYFDPVDYSAKTRSEKRIAETQPELASTANKSLRQAARRGDLAAVKDLLMQEETDVNTQGMKGNTPLHLAVEGKYKEIVTVLLEFDPLESDNRKSSSFKRSKADVNRINKAGYAPIHSAVSGNDVETVRILLEGASQRIDLLLKTAKTNYTPLDLAMRHVVQPNLEIIRLILLYMKDGEVDSCWSDDLTPLSYSARSGNETFVNTLLENNATVNKIDAQKMAPILWASLEGHEEIVSTLINRSADIEVKNVEGCTALHIAALGGHERVVLRLLAGGASLYARTNTNSTVLHLATSARKTNVAQFLLRELSGSAQGLALINELDDSKHTAWYFAIKSGSQDLMNIFLEHQDKIELRNLAYKDIDPNVLEIASRLLASKEDKPWNLLHWAVYYGDSELVWPLVRNASRKYTTEEISRAGKIASRIQEGVRQTLDTEKRPKHSTPSGTIEKDGSNIHISNPLPSPLSATDMAAISTVMSQATDENENENDKENIAEESLNEPHFLIEEYEDQYSDILDMIRYPDIPFNPSSVEVDNQGTEFVNPKIDIANGESLERVMSYFYAGITDIYEKDGRYGFLRRARNVYKVVYRDGPEAIMRAARHEDPSLYASEALKLRWIHLPANNLKWMEDLVLRICVDEVDVITENEISEADEASPVSGDTNETQYVTENLDPTLQKSKKDYYYLADFLKRSWHQLPSGKSATHFMKPGCVLSPNYKRQESASKKKSKSEEPVSNALALYMPYLTLSTLTARTEAADTNNVEEHILNKQIQTVPLQFQGIQGTTKFDKDFTRSTKKLSSIISRLQDPTKSSNFHKLKSSTSHEQKILKLPPESVMYRELLDLYKDRGNCKLHGSRTLDESYYHSVSDEDQEAIRDMDRRNADQVVTKRVQDFLHPTDPKSRDILRVGQLWLWIIDEKTIISSSTHRVLENEKDPVLEGIWNYLQAEVAQGRSEVPLSAHKMAEIVTDFCINFFDNSTCRIRVGPMYETIQQVYENSINKAAREEAKLFGRFTEKVANSIERESLKSQTDYETESDEAVEDKKAQTSVTSKDDGKKGPPQKVENGGLGTIKSIRSAANVMKNVKDIRDELNMLKAILSHQMTVWNQLHDTSSKKDHFRGPAYYLNDIKEMDSQAERIQGAIGSILDLEQNEAAIDEAISSRQQATQSLKQGNILMVFTVITIIFLPMSFITSLLALDIDGFPQSADGMKIQGVSWSRYVYGYIFGPAAGFFIAVYMTTMQLERTKWAMWKTAEALANLSLGIYAWVLNLASSAIGRIMSKASTPADGNPAPLEAKHAEPVYSPDQNNQPPNVTPASEQRHVGRRNSVLPGSKQRVVDEENPPQTFMDDRDRLRNQ